MADLEDGLIEKRITCVEGGPNGPWNYVPANIKNNAGGRKSKKSAKKSTRKSSTRKNKKSNKKNKKSQKGGSSLTHSDFNASQSVDSKLSLAGSIESGLFPGVQKITGGMNTGGMNTGGMNTGGMNMGGMNTTTPKSMMRGGSGCSAKMLGGKKKKNTSKK